MENQDVHLANVRRVRAGEQFSVLDNGIHPRLRPEAFCQRRAEERRPHSENDSEVVPSGPRST